MKFSKDQSEGLARFIDTIAASALIGAVVGASGHSTIGPSEVAVLLVICPILLIASFFLRRSK
jgi:hypothetical protein